MKYKVLLLTAITFITTCFGSNAKNILSLKESITDNAIVYPSSFETNTKEMMENWYLKNYAIIDESNIETRDYGLVSDAEYIRRLKALPTEIEMPFNQIVKSYIERYIVRSRTLVAQMLGMCPYYMPIFEEALERHQMPLELKYMPIIESALNPNAVSPAGAGGLWQFMITTAKGVGLTVDTQLDERRDPYRSSEKAAVYFKQLYDTYHDWSLAIAAYNCGPGNVNKSIRRAGTDNPDFWEIYNYLPRETRGYVPAFIAANYVMTYYQKHNINPTLTKKPLIIDTVAVTKRIHLDQISQVLNIPIDEIKILNPQYRAGVINFIEIADRYGMEYDELKELNELASTTLHTGQVLKVVNMNSLIEETVMGSQSSASTSSSYNSTSGQELVADNSRTNNSRYNDSGYDSGNNSSYNYRDDTSYNSRNNNNNNSNNSSYNNNNGGRNNSNNGNNNSNNGRSNVSSHDKQQVPPRPEQHKTQQNNVPDKQKTTAKNDNKNNNNTAKNDHKNNTAKNDSKNNTAKNDSKNTAKNDNKNSKKTSEKKEDKKPAQPSKHKVKEGDNITKIASHYGISQEDLRAANNINGDHIEIGQNLTIPEKGYSKKHPQPKQTQKEQPKQQQGKHQQQGKQQQQQQHQDKQGKQSKQQQHQGKQNKQQDKQQQDNNKQGKQGKQGKQQQQEQHGKQSTKQGKQPKNNSTTAQPNNNKPKKKK